LGRHVGRYLDHPLDFSSPEGSDCDLCISGLSELTSRLSGSGPVRTRVAARGDLAGEDVAGASVSALDLLPFLEAAFLKSADGILFLKKPVDTAKVMQTGKWKSQRESNVEREPRRQASVQKKPAVPGAMSSRS